MPVGSFINILPPAVFLLVHLTAFSIGAFFAYRAFEHGQQLLGWAFSLFALAEVSYMTYHLDRTVILFAHTIPEALDLVALLLVFSAAVYRGLVSSPARSQA